MSAKICIGTTREGLPCDKPTFGGSRFCGSCAGRRGVAARRENLAALRAGRIPLASPADILAFLERLASSVLHASGPIDERAQAGAVVTAAARALIKDDLEALSAELAALAKQHGKQP